MFKRKDYEPKYFNDFKSFYLYVDDEENRAYEFEDRIADFNPAKEKTSGGIGYLRVFYNTYFL